MDFAMCVLGNLTYDETASSGGGGGRTDEQFVNTFPRNCQVFISGPRKRNPCPSFFRICRLEMNTTSAAKDRCLFMLDMCMNARILNTEAPLNHI